ncbi:MAG: hypothetical protein P1V51_06140 [Deltaproteobacteria bacterium]|nr:hypothetical protein [Deltaproteobacteria bacterium]
MKVRALVLLAAVLPFTAQAAKIVPGFTDVTVGERGTISVTLTVQGPAKGPFKVGLVNGKKLTRGTAVELTEIAAGAFVPVMAELRVGNNPVGTHAIGLEGPNGILAQTTVTIVPGPKQESFLGKKGKETTIATYIQKRDADLKRGFIDDQGEGLHAVFFLKIAETGAAHEVVFKHKNEAVCSDTVHPAGFKGQIVRVRASCRSGGGEEEGGAEGGDDAAIVDDMGDMSKPIALGSSEPLPGEGDIVVEDETSGELMPLDSILEKAGPWKVEVKKGTKVKRVLTFSVKRKAIVPGIPGRAPLKMARVQVLAP